MITLHVELTGATTVESLVSFRSRAGAVTLAMGYADDGIVVHPADGVAELIDGTVSARITAGVLGCSVATVYNYVNAGHLVAAGDRRGVSLESLERYAASVGIA